MLAENSHLIEIGSLVQINPETKNQIFAGCIVVVTEITSCGIQGYVQALGTDSKLGGQAFLRPTWKDIEPVGYAHWVINAD